MRKNEKRQWILLAVLMLLGMMKSCNLQAQAMPEIVVYHIDDIFYVKGNQVSSESGRFDSLCVDRDAAFRYLETLTIEASKRFPIEILSELKGSILVWDNKYEVFRWSMTSRFYPYWTIDIEYESPSPKIKNVFIPVEATLDGLQTTTDPYGYEEWER